MLANNQNNLTPNPDGNVNGGSHRRTPIAPSFVDLSQFSAWLDGELQQLEQSFHQFETTCSRRDNFRQTR